MFTSRTIRLSWIQVRCTVLSYRPLSVGSTRRWPIDHSHSLHVIVALERIILHPVLSYRPPWVGSTCVQDIHYDEICWDWLWAIVPAVLITRWTCYYLWWVYFTWIYLPDELVAWHGIYLIRWHIYFDDEFSDEISICIYYFLGKYTGFTARGYKCCFEMIFEKTLFLPTHAFVLRPSRY